MAWSFRSVSLFSTSFISVFLLFPSFFKSFRVWGLPHVRSPLLLKYFFSRGPHFEVKFFITVQLSIFLIFVMFFLDQYVLQKSVVKFPNIYGSLKVIFLLLITNRILLWSENLIVILDYFLILALWLVRGQCSNDYRVLYISDRLFSFCAFCIFFKFDNYFVGLIH